jgi:hypothetical protein
VVRLSREGAGQWAVHLASEGTRPDQEFLDGWRAAVEDVAAQLELVVDRVRQF